MKKQVDLKSVTLVIYLMLILLTYMWIIYPAIVRPKGLTQTKVPSLLVPGLVEAKGLFISHGKESAGNPAKPDISRFSFGQKDPI